MPTSLPKDANRVTVLGATSSTDGVTVVKVYADPTTNRLLVNLNNNFADGEIPTGTINGTNAIFNLVNTPSPATSLILIIGGGALRGGGVDYTISGTQITMITAPPTGQTWTGAWYRY